VNAWNGLALWATVSDNRALKKEASGCWRAKRHPLGRTGLISTPFDPVYSNYTHSVVALNWGGKRDYSTWFSADVNAKPGIQLIPMSLAIQYLGGDATRIARSVIEATAGDYRKQFRDYLLRYSALGGGDQANAAVPAARNLPAKFIDDGNSRSYLLTWIMTRR